MFVPLIFTLDTHSNPEYWVHWEQFYVYADACIRNKWPLISHERYIKRFSHVDERIAGYSLKDVASYLCMSEVPTTEKMRVLKTYSVAQAKEDALISQYASQFDCWVDLLRNDNPAFERIIGELLDRIMDDFEEKPEGILAYEYLPKALLRAASNRGIPVIFQVGGIVRPPFASVLNACSLINTNSAEAVEAKYASFLSQIQNVPMLTHKGLLRLYISEQYAADVHNISMEPEYDVGVLHHNLQVALFHTGQEYVSDQELSARAKAKYDKVLIRTRPGYEPVEDALDKSPTCFHFCCKCRRVLGLSTKGMFEAMLAGRIAHEYGSFIFHSFSNNGIEDDSKGPVPVEFLNFVLFGWCTPFSWLTNPEHLRFLLSNPSEKEQYLRGFHYYTQGISKEDLELYYMSDDRAYRLGDVLYFTSGHKPHEYAAYYCLGGLHDNGGVCTWSNGESTSYAFDFAEPVNEPLTISVVLYDVAMDWGSSNPTQTVSCEANGLDCGSVTLTPEKRYLRFIIPTGCCSDKLQIVFRYSYLLPSGDVKIAVAFERMYISRAGQRSIEDAMSHEIAALAQKLSEVESQNAGLHAQVSGLESHSAELKWRVSGLEADNAQLSAQITGLVTHTAEQSAQITSLIAHTADQSAQITGLVTHTAEQSAQITSLIAHTADQSAQITGLVTQTAEQSAQITSHIAHTADQSAHIKGLEAQIQSIYSSRSWKLGNGIMNTAAKVLKRKK